MRGDMTGGFDGKFPFENSISLMYATIDFMFSNLNFGENNLNIPSVRSTDGTSKKYDTNKGN